MIIQFQTIRKILDLATSDGRLEDAIAELENFAKLRATTFVNFVELCLDPEDWFNEDGSQKTITEIYDKYKAESKAV